MIERLALFGATGDLAGRFLFPAMAALIAGGHLPDGFTVTGAGRQDLDDEAFRRRVDGRLADHAGDVPVAARRRLVRALRYRAVDVADPASVVSLFAGEAGPVAAYLALPPSLFPVAVGSLGRVGLPTGSRIVLEKPFGKDLDGAISLNRQLAEVARDAGEQAIFRVDHVLGMATTQNLVALRQNRVLDPIWNGTHVEQVEILWEETLALEGRAGYYDAAGALRDVLQNHMLQVLCLVAMEPPANADERELRERKLDVLRSVRPPSSAELPSRSRRARYGAGWLTKHGESGAAVPAYAHEDGVDPMRGTETFVELTLELEAERWSGTPFVLRAGKALSRRRKGILIRFRSSQGQAASELWIGIEDSSEIVLRLTGGAFGEHTEVELRGESPPADLPAYACVLLDILTGGSTLSVRADEAEQAWRVVTPVLESWRASQVPLEEYEAGSDGPRR
jgi:glucose-6-phosphate 1-dehydrogenase